MTGVKRWPRPVGYLLLLLMAGGLFIYQRLDRYPRDRVEASVVNIPDGTHFLCIVTDAGGALRSMDWSPEMFFTSFRMGAVDCIWSYRNPDEADSLVGHVVWEWGGRYGVVRRQMDRTWWVTWFAAGDPIADRQWVFGGGTVRFDLSKGRLEPLPPGQVQELGLTDIRRAEETQENS